LHYTNYNIQISIPTSVNIYWWLAMSLIVVNVKRLFLTLVKVKSCTKTRSTTLYAIGIGPGRPHIYTTPKNGLYEIGNFDSFIISKGEGASML